MGRVRIPIGKDRYVTVFTAEEVEKRVSASGGIVGPQGPTGLTGAKGDAGSQGIQGPKGDTGAQGLKGDIGNQGIQGVKGDIGLTGNQGIQGIQGETGQQGVQGIPGSDATVNNANVISAIGFTPANSTHNHNTAYLEKSTGVLPAASATYRNKVRVVQGATGVADRIYMCVKNADDTYAWIDMLGMSYGY